MMQLSNSVKILPATFGKTADGMPTIRGLVHSIRDIVTKTGTKKILVSVGDVICKIKKHPVSWFSQFSYPPGLGFYVPQIVQEKPNNEYISHRSTR
jgi:hypothetical protein